MAAVPHNLMTRKWSNQNLPGALHFVTGNIIDRITIFNQEGCSEAFIEELRTLILRWPAKLISWVLMPEHFHLIVNPQDGDIQSFVRSLKSLATRKLWEVSQHPGFILEKPAADGSIHQVWQDSFKALPLWSSWMIWQKINYIHANPVKAGLVKSAKDYRWSSFRAFYHDSKEPLPIDQDWWWPDDSQKLTAEMIRLGWRNYL